MKLEIIFDKVFKIFNWLVLCVLLFCVSIWLANGNGLIFFAAMIGSIIIISLIYVRNDKKEIAKN